MEIRLLRLDDLEQISGLFFECFHENIKKSFFNWKYFQNPNGESFIAGIYEDNQLIASGALIPEFLGVKKIYKFTDLMTSPHHRNKGLSKKIVHFLTDIGLKETGIIYTLCSKTATRSFQKHGWNHFENVIYLFKPRFVSFNFIKLNHTYTVLDQTLIPQFLESFEENNQKQQTFETLLWRIQNPKFEYKLIFNTQNRSQFLLFSIRNKNAFLLHINDVTNFLQSYKMLCQHFLFLRKLNIRNSILISIPHLRLNKRFFLAGYFYNFFEKGKMSSILDLNIICNPDQNEIAKAISTQFSPVFYDDI